MALNKPRLQASLEAKIRTSQGLDATPYPQLTAYAGALADAIISEIVDFADVNPVKTVFPSVRLTVDGASGGGFGVKNVEGLGKVD